MPRREPRQSPLELFPPAPGKPPETDLRPVSRDVKRCVTVVTLYPDWDRANAVKWLIMGAASISKENREGQFRLEARFCEGVTDFEHDSAYVCRLPLIGLTMGDLFVYNHHIHFVAWVDPNDPEGFHVPGPGYDPRKEDGAYRCKDGHCKKDNGGKGHMIVPEGFYVPPFNADLYKMVRGKKVEIRMGPVFEDPDDNEE
jgi:hypothetical protein